MAVSREKEGQSEIAKFCSYKSYYTNHSGKTPLIELEKDLHWRVYKRERLKTWNKVNWSYCKHSFLCKQWYLARLNLEKAIFKPEN